MRGLEALEVQNQNTILELTHDQDVRLEIEKALCEERIYEMRFTQGKG